MYKGMGSILMGMAKFGPRLTRVRVHNNAKPNVGDFCDELKS